MGHLTQDKKFNDKGDRTARHGRRGVAAGAVIFFGALIGKNAAGHIVRASDAAAVSVIGISEEHVDNSAGLAGAVKCSYITGLEVELENAGGAIVLANLGRGCYVADDQSVTTRAVSVHKVFVGTVQEFTAAKVWAFIDEAHIGVLGDEQIGNVLAGGIGIPLVATYDIADAASADYDIVVPDLVEVLDAWAIKTAANGGAANTVQVKSTADAITDAMSLNINDQLLARALSVNDAHSKIVPGGLLRAAVVKAGGNAACKLVVTFVKRAA